MELIEEKENLTLTWMGGGAYVVTIRDHMSIYDWYVVMCEFRIDIKKKYVAVRLDYVLKT